MNESIRQENISQEQTSIACKTHAIPDKQRKRHFEEVTPKLLKLIDRIEERENGYVLYFAPADDVYPLVTEFVGREQKCCPFMGFNIAVEPVGQHISLSLTGGEGVKSFLRTTFAEFVGKF